jgi:signal transduction histidine kinase
MTMDQGVERARTERLAQLGALFAGFAHEVRNPLSTIGLNLQLVEEENWDPENARDRRTQKRIHVLKGEVARLQGILDEFLSFARMPELSKQPTDLEAFVRDLVEFHAPEMQELGITLRAFAQAGLPQLSVDRAHLRAAIVNLLKNAREACRSGDEVIVALRPEGSGVAISVTDTGPGMGKEVLAKVFQPYFSTKKTGTGLGLPTVKRIVEEHGGKVSVSSEPGKGTLFTLWFPGASEGAGS